MVNFAYYVSYGGAVILGIETNHFGFGVIAFQKDRLSGVDTQG